MADDLVVSCWLRRHHLTVFFVEALVGQDLLESPSYIFHIGALAADAPGGLGIGVFAFVTDLVHDVESLERLGVAGGKAFLDAVYKIPLLEVAILYVALPGKGVYVAVVDAGGAFLVTIVAVCGAVELLALAALGVFALFVEHAPFPDFGDVGGKGNLSARFKIRDRLAKEYVGVAPQVGLAFVRAATPEVEVGVDQVRLLCHECGKEFPENGPKDLNGPFVGLRARCGLGDRDEVVDFGGGCLDVELHKLLLRLGDAHCRAGERCEEKKRAP